MDGPKVTFIAGRSSLDAAPFVPRSASSASISTTALNAPSFVPKTSQATPPSGSSPTAATAAVAKFDLPEGDDDLLGMKSVVPGGASDLATQAADMLQSLRPFQPSTSSQPSSSSSQQQQQAVASSKSERGRGRGRGRGRSGRGAPGAHMSTGPGGGFHYNPHQQPSGKVPAARYFVPESLREELQRRNYLVAATYDPDALHEAGIPDTVQNYHTLCPLEDLTYATEKPSGAFGVKSLVIKGLYAGDGKGYAIRRIDGRQVLPTAELLEAAQVAVQRWAPLAGHPYMVALRDAFASDEIEGMPAIHFVHDYHPGAITLEETHLMPTTNHQGLLQHNPPTEEQLWSYLTQLACAIRSAHTANLALHPASLTPSKVQLTSSKRIRVGSIGVARVLLAEGAAQDDLAKQQQEDLVGVGTLILTLVCGARNARPSLDVLMGSYSRELCQVVAGLLASVEGSGFTTWRPFLNALGDRVFVELEATAARKDESEIELQKDCENGRLARLMIKLGMINERPELAGDDQWSETGDRYLLKLFRDFVFHQTDESGAPVLDWGLAVEALNKADAGVTEKIMLLNRDETAMLVVSYADIKRCIENAYGELKTAASFTDKKKG